MARTKYGYAETSDVRATIAGHLPHITNDTLALENGQPVVIDKIDSGEVYKVKKPTATTEPILIHHSALYSYDDSTTLGQHEMYLRLEAGEVGRAYPTEPLDRWAFADYMIKPLSTNLVVGNYIVIDPDGTESKFYEEIASATDITAYGFVAVIEAIEKKSANMTLVRVRVLKNETGTVDDVGA